MTPSRIRVGLEATYLLTAEKSGVETYTLNLVRGLLSLRNPPELGLYLAGRQAPPAAAELFRRAWRVRRSPLRRLWLRLHVSVLMRWDGVRVAHFPGTLLPLWLPCPAVTTFYDLAAVHHPELYDAVELRLYRRLVPQAAHRAAVVLAISETTKQDLVTHFDVAADKVKVTPLAASSRFAPVPDARRIVADRFGIDAPYVLACVGSGHPRKNLVAVVHAWERLSSDTLLVIVGSIRRDVRAREAVAQSPKRDWCRVLGHVPETDLAALYSAAEAFCYPSLYEGFGLPVLEAMACGAPVVCSNTSSLPEVAGEAAVFVAPRDVEALAAALDRILTDDQRRAELSVAGRRRAGLFSWRRTAELTVAAYHRAIDG